jgi:hypothetical protein
MKSALVLVIAAGAVNADPVIWDNTVDDDLTLLSSQNDTAYPFDSQLADDFMFTDMGYFVTDVHWKGGFWNGTPINPIDFNIYFYADDGTGQPTQPGTELAQYNFQDVLGTDDGAGFLDYSVDLPTPFTANAGETYWVAIQWEGLFPPQWGWAASLNGVVDYGSPALQGFPLLGTPYWSDPGYGDAYWQLTGVPIPAPASAALLGLGGLMLRRRR